MRGLAFPESDRETSHEYGSPFRNPSEIPIDPALGGQPIDLELTGEQLIDHSQAQSESEPEPPQQEQYIYSDAPQGDPFSPQPFAFHVQQLPPQPQPESTPRPAKRKRKFRSDICSFCKGDERRNKKTGRPEAMLTCCECERSAHYTCLHLTHADQAVVESVPWRCIECKCCEICNEKGDDSRILFCDRCDKGWHMDCLDPPLDHPPQGHWYCPPCDLLGYRQSVEPEPQVTGNGKAKARAAVLSSDSSSSSECDDDTESGNQTTPLTKRRVRNAKDQSQPIEPIRSAKKKKRKRSRLEVPSSQAMPPLRIRLKRNGQGGEEEPVKGLFDDILTVDQRDTSKTAILNSDKQRFDRTRLIAEAKLAVPAGLRDSEQPEAGPSSRPLRSSTLQQITTAASSQSPAPSTPGALPSFLLPGAKPQLRIRTIRFGEYDIKTWFDAPFPEEYANIPDGRLWLCEFCLKYMKSRFGADRHRMKCKCRHPPGDEIYRDATVSIFEVDGRKNKIYCQNLCLLSKMFLDHKSLFYDVEPFLFYVITEVDDAGAHFVGYFSKEKRSVKDYNLSCIMTLPVRQRQGWGNFLIDFSYQLSKKEQRLGSPEKPLSGLGALGYKNYWTLAVMRYLNNDPPANPRLDDISAATSMTLEDVHATLIQQNMITVHDVTPVIRPSPGQTIKFPKGRKNGVARRHLQRAQTADKGAEKQGPFVPPIDYEIKWDKEKVKQYLQNWETKGYLQLRPDKLKWSPFVMSRTQKTEALQATATATLETTNDQANGKSTALTTTASYKALSNGDRPSATPQKHLLASDDELVVDLPSTDKKATRIASHQILAENITPGRRLRNHLPTVDKPLPPSTPPVKRPRGRPRKVVQPVQAEPVQAEPDNRGHSPVLRRPRKQVVSSPEPDESGNGISETRAAEADVNGTKPPAFPSDDVKSERSSTPMTRASVPSDDTIFGAVNSLLGLKAQMPQQEMMQLNREGSLDDVDADADGDYDIEMEDA